jgi:mono/diheme cytochrome c family protein
MQSINALRKSMRRMLWYLLFGIGVTVARPSHANGQRASGGIDADRITTAGSEAQARLRAQLALHPAATRTARTLITRDTTGEELFRMGCASCHGMDGTGTGAGVASLDIPVPDFTDCSFQSREPDADWLAVVHEGGPVRGFDTTMPAFGDAFSEDQILAILAHVRSFCTNRSYPRGELNLPRAMVTEKAYPEDEAVSTVTIDYDVPGAVMNELVYERRFGIRNQWELKVPFGAVEGAGGSGWEAGLGDIEIGLKRTMWHSLSSGSIFALGVDAGLPTGRESVGLGKGTFTVEPYASFGQIVAVSGFLQFQGAFEVPAEEKPAAEKEAILRGVAGWTFAQNHGFGRTWTPMLEVFGSRELEDGAAASWDVLPQMQVSLNTRQHVLASFGVRMPLTDRDLRSSSFVFYILWDWFDGGLLDGW